MGDDVEPSTGTRAKRAAGTATPAKKTPAKVAATPVKKATKTPSKAASPAAKKAATTTANRTAAAKPAAATAKSTKAAATPRADAPRPSRPSTPRPPRRAPVHVDLDPDPDPDPVPEPQPVRLFTPARPSGDDGRPKASSVIADLWQEREEQIVAASPPPVVDPRQPRTGAPSFMSGKGGLVAAIVAVAVLLGGGLGVYLAHAGVGIPSKTTFIAKADAVCRTTNVSVAGIGKPTSYPDLANATRTVVTAGDAQLAGLRKVHLPGGTAGTAAGDAIASLATANQAAHSLADAAGNKDDAATAAATSHLMTQFTDANAKAKAFGFTACGTGMQTGMDNVTGGAKGLVKTSFLAKADSLCREASRQLDALAPFKATNADIARYLGQGLAITTRTTNDLRALAPPPGDEATVADMLSAQDKVNAKIGELRDATAAGDRTRIVAADHELDVLGTAADAKVDAYGLEVCGSNFGES